MKVMRYAGTLACCMLGVASATLFARQDMPVAEGLEAINNQSASPLPECAGLCYVQALPEFNCPLNDITCICPNANLTTAISACLSSNCTMPDQLIAEKFSKDSCGAISRDEASTTRRVTWVLFTLAIFFVGARFIARPERLHGSGYGTDDWTILSCVVLLIPINALSQTMTNVGLGTDNYTNSADDITTMLMQFFVFLILYTLLVFTTKVSILQLYLRIWTEDATSRWFRLTCWILILLQIVTMLSYCISIIFMCTPVAYSWKWWDGLHSGHCVNRKAQIYSLGAINICFDVIVFILPLHNFLKLNISWKRKMGVCTIFMVGVLVTVCSIIRLQYLVKVGISTNPTWDYNSAVLWSIIECNFSVICTCMPATAGLLQRLYAAISGHPQSISTGSSNGSKAPIHPNKLDPERALTSDDMLRMRGEDRMLDGDMNEMSSTDSNAPTAVARNHAGEVPFELDSEEEGEKKGHVSLYHSPPREMTATDLTYRDGEGRLHEVKVIDRPTSDVKDPEDARHETAGHQLERVQEGAEEGDGEGGEAEKEENWI
ncbi:unnamed protein product [Zymoseptoria tritici ST99CH_3D1]|nr:unnamed protein product [Zymoseptoria tritici ST99CH_3D1]